ncbi:hypothetical protein AAZV13_15G165700 [Glycine max]|uniref:uncharacterized protein n=1 Tax=Glycine max TaxID=3847 RepID=UPI0003DED7EB|nr:uncharacterized protein LOC100781058 [Glycine max]XP_028201528.1 uncharacterized protein LOC114385694 [Glycine soja]XP_028201530.1 uncharacterized protein LOC114385694 [Glycine soja]|eukprot:XP_025981666.1 uncharacterized protein LOC100781058 [Glycine max]
MPTKMAATSRAPFSVRVSILTTSTPLAGDTIPAPVISEQQTPNLQSLVAAAPPTTVARNLGFRPSPELGLLSHLFVLSMAFGAFFSVAVFSIATLILNTQSNKIQKKQAQSENNQTQKRNQIQKQSRKQN